MAGFRSLRAGAIWQHETRRWQPDYPAPLKRALLRAMCEGRC
jgi:hypothetical protein